MGETPSNSNASICSLTRIAASSAPRLAPVHRAATINPAAHRSQFQQHRGREERRQVFDGPGAGAGEYIAGVKPDDHTQRKAGHGRERQPAYQHRVQRAHPLAGARNGTK